MGKNKMKVEVWTDIMCPYCYIGKIHYEKALRQFEHADDVELEWKSFQLNPDLPGNGKGYALAHYLTQIVGMSEDKMNLMFSGVKKLAEDAGVTSNLPNAFAANTRDAHRLVKLAATKGMESEVLRDLTKAYFEDGTDYSDRKLLLSIGMKAGLEEEEINEMLDSEAYLYEIKQDMQEMANLGFDTVPTFLMDRRQAIVGSEPIDLFLKVLRKAHNNWKSRNEKEQEIKVSKGNSCSADGECEI